jgi:hypothetical protein
MLPCDGYCDRRQNEHPDSLVCHFRYCHLKTFDDPELLSELARQRKSSGLGRSWRVLTRESRATVLQQAVEVLGRSVAEALMHSKLYRYFDEARMALYRSNCYLVYWVPIMVLSFVTGSDDV